MSGVATAHLLAIAPSPLVVVEHPPELTADGLETLLWKVGRQLCRDRWEALLGPGCRCVDLERLEHVLTHGIDVEPPTAPIWVSFLSKALEYGRAEKLLLVFDPERLDRTFREVDSRLDPAELARLRATYPVAEPSVDGATIWLSRLPENDTRRTSGYEAEYARWIPGDPWEALQLLLVLGPQGRQLTERVVRACQAATRARWQVIDAAAKPA